MRILYVNNINRVAESYATELTRHGHTIQLYQPDLRGGNEWLPMKLALMPRRLLSLQPLLRKLKRNSFDLAHIHWASYGILGLMSEIPFIVECHGSDVRHRLRHPLFRALLSTIFKRAAAVLCITPDLVPVVQTVCPRALFFPAPINTAYFSPEHQPRKEKQPWTILLFARLDPEKGSEIAVAALLRFAERHPGARIQLLDWGPMKEEYRRRYGDSVEFLPFLPQEQVKELILSADVIVGQFGLGLGLCELQSMSCAKPVIGFFRDAQAYPLPPPILQATTADEIDKHLEILFQRPADGLALGQQARKWIIQHHDRDMLAVRLEALYQSILS